MKAIIEPEVRSVPWKYTEMCAACASVIMYEGIQKENSFTGQQSYLVFNVAMAANSPQIFEGPP